MSQVKHLQTKILSFSALKGQLEKWRNANQKIVFTNGCFDLLHFGHVDYLTKARDLGDRLVVGLNTDGSIKRIKGAARPINNEESRAALLAGMAYVDAVVLFDEETPINLVSMVMPDVLVRVATTQLKRLWVMK